jgi:hypothetical protein
MSETDVTMFSDDLELITRYLNNQLTPEQRADVERRLSTDQAFYEYVEPMLFAWTVAQHEVKKPRPEGELEAMWDKFTKEAGFVHQKKRARVRRLWMIAIALAAVGLSVFFTRERIQAAYLDWRDYVPMVPTDSAWIPLRENMQIRAEPGARMRVAKELKNGAQFVKLDAGQAHFRVQLKDSTVISPDMTPVVVRTRATNVYSGYGDFTVTVRGDTTDVQDLPPARPRYVGFMPFPSMTMVRASDYAEPVRVQSGERVRLIVGQPLQRIP